MKTIHKKLMTLVAIALLLFAGSGVWATNIQFTEGPVIYERIISDNTIIVQFSLGWDNSWKLNSPPNHDAAWIFMKFRPLGQHGFRHANLRQEENIVLGTDGSGAGSTPHNVRYGMSPHLAEGRDVAVGVFLSRSEISVGSNVFENVQLHWDITDLNILEETILSVRVFAIEMVYVPMGAFHSPHTTYPSGQIQTTTIPLGMTTTHTTANATAIAANSHWPLGTAPFYIMKHEVTQHAWVDFLNTLTLEQQMSLSHVDPHSPANTRFRDIGGAGGSAIAINTWPIQPTMTNMNASLINSRMFIRVRQPAVGNTPAVFGINAQPGTPSGADAWNHEVQGGNVPMFSLAWTDVMAYLAWAGLRPLTELEYERAARGNLQVVADEFVWGNADVTVATTGFNNINMPNEISGVPAANRSTPSDAQITAHAADGATLQRWPIRAGAFAREATTRVEAGASFWGVMNLSDNVAERFISFTHARGHAFLGTHGDGNLTGSGQAAVADWPGVGTTTTRANRLGADGAEGTIYRGIGLTNINTVLAWSGRNHGVSSRANVAVHNSRDPWTGARGGRSVPVEFQIMSHPSTEVRPALMTGQQGSQPVAWSPVTHTLSVAPAGGELPHTFQWFWTEDLVVAGATPSGEPIVGATSSSFMPPQNVAHGPRFYFATITDATGEVLTSNLSGMHSVIAITAHPSTTNLTTSLTQGTLPLDFEMYGGTPPFRITWNFTPNGAPGTHTVAGTATGNNSGELEHHPIIPVWAHQAANGFTFWAQVEDFHGVIVRTNQSGLHQAGGITFSGPGNQGSVVPANNAASSQAGVVAAADFSNHIHQVNLPPGLFSFELWGASGGRGAWQNTAMHQTLTADNTSGPNSGWGGYTVAFRRIEENVTLFAVPGGSGVHGQWTSAGSIRLPGGFNGGGQGGSPNNNQGTRGGSGGGATHLSTAPGLLTDPAVRAGIWLAAGGGGGGGCWGGLGNHRWSGGHGGGLIGFGNMGDFHSGGTQTSGGQRGLGGQAAGHILVATTPGVAGQGGNGAHHTNDNRVAGRHGFGGGGGGGWFGGGGGAQGDVATTADASRRTIGGGGGGGSGYIRDHMFLEAGEFHGGPSPNPASGVFAPSAPATNLARAVGANAGAATTAQHPQGLQSRNQIRGGSVRILRLQ